MNFLFDDDGVGGNPRSQTQTQTQSQIQTVPPEDGFHCLNCGGTSCYTEGSTGNLICLDCFTQSQNLIASSQEELDFGEMAGLAGRASGGFVGRNHWRRPGSKSRETLEEIDQTVPLVDLQDCMQGMQRVLVEATRIACDLAQTAEHEKTLQAVKTIWEAYLKAWSAGAEYYGAIYPEVRFSFRDFFFDNFSRTNLIKTLTYWSTKRLREDIMNRVKEEGRFGDEGDNEESQGAGGMKKTEQEDNGNSMKSEPIGEIPIQELQTDEKGTGKSNEDIGLHDDLSSLPKVVTKHATNDNISQCSALSDGEARSQDCMRQIERMILHHMGNGGKHSKRVVGRLAAALILKPSMTMVACILWIALSPIGVGIGQIREWIGDGSLPLLDSFRLLSDSEREKLKTVHGFFRMVNLPTIPVLKRHVCALQVACGYEPRKILTRKHGSEQRFVATSSRDFKPGRVMTPTCVPMMAARFISEFGLGQRVLDYTLALMGFPGTGNSWLPPQIRQARPDRLLQPALVLGVIVVACKLASPTDTSLLGSRSQIPEWHRHHYKRPFSSQSENERRENAESESRRATKRSKRFIPWNAHYLSYIGHGGLTGNYLDFLEEDIIDLDAPFLVGSVRTLGPASTATVHQESAPPYQSFAPRTATSPMQAKTTSVSTARFFKQPTDNPVSKSSKKRRKYEISKLPEAGFCCPAQGPLGPLIEHMANKSGASPSDISNFVTHLDRALERKGRQF